MRGKNLETGSFKGRSTVGIAYVTRELDLGTVVAVDPHTSPAGTDPDLRGKATSYDDFVANLRLPAAHPPATIVKGHN
ncbi:MAG TPA: hypothetical protein VHE82_13105 [Gemmatimonadaceae bacterium]|nr:hypothetical protein [Gemmatimonadaceae bacterium]